VVEAVVKGVVREVLKGEDAEVIDALPAGIKGGIRVGVNESVVWEEGRVTEGATGVVSVVVLVSEFTVVDATGEGVLVGSIDAPWLGVGESIGL
jgi:hypothetical protein